MSRQRRTSSTSNFEDDYSMDEANSNRREPRTPRGSTPKPRKPSLRRQVLMREQERLDSPRPSSLSRRHVSYGETFYDDPQSAPSPYASPQATPVARVPPEYFAYDGVRFVEPPSSQRRQSPYRVTENGRVYRKSPYPDRVREGETPPYQVTRSNRKVYRLSPHPTRRSQPELIFEDSPSFGHQRSHSRSRSRSRQVEELAPQVLDFGEEEEEVFPVTPRREPHLRSFANVFNENDIARLRPSLLPPRTPPPRQRPVIEDENVPTVRNRPQYDVRRLHEGLITRQPDRRLNVQAPPPNDPAHAQPIKVFCECCDGEIH